MKLSERQVNQLKIAFHHLDNLNALIPNPEIRKQSEADARVAIENTLREIGQVHDDPIYGVEIEPSQCEHVGEDGARCEEISRYHTTKRLYCSEHYLLHSTTVDPVAWCEVESR